MRPIKCDKQTAKNNSNNLQSVAFAKTTPAFINVYTYRHKYISISISMSQLAAAKSGNEIRARLSSLSWQLSKHICHLIDLFCLPFKRHRTLVSRSYYCCSSCCPFTLTTTTETAATTTLKQRQQATGPTDLWLNCDRQARTQFVDTFHTDTVYLFLSSLS